MAVRPFTAKCRNTGSNRDRTEFLSALQRGEEMRAPGLAGRPRAAGEHPSRHQTSLWVRHNCAGLKRERAPFALDAKASAASGAFALCGNCIWTEPIEPSRRCHRGSNTFAIASCNSDIECCRLVRCRIYIYQRKTSALCGRAEGEFSNAGDVCSGGRFVADLRFDFQRLCGEFRRSCASGW